MTRELRDSAEKLLRKAVGDHTATFRDGQWEAIQSVFHQRNPVLLVQRTGWGKSYVYFILTRLLREAGSGLTVILSPLLSLMRDQIRAAERLELQARTINSANTTDWRDVENELAAQSVDLLFLSPERFGKGRFVSEQFPLFRERIGLLVVDEVHCISDWGHDFRPDYRLIGRMIRNLPPATRILATTATANNRVIEDVRSQLGAETEIRRGTLNRPSLQLDRIPLETREERMAWLAQHLPSLPGSGIIYTLTVRDAEQVSEWLSTQGINAPAYHGKTDNRRFLEHALHDNSIKALVATSALGMGFDKPDLGFVIHYQRPQSPVHYYQQVGRAGRSISNALGIVFFGEEDNRIAEYFINSQFPDHKIVTGVLDELRKTDDGMTLKEIERKVNGRPGKIEAVLKILRAEDPPVVGCTQSRWYILPNRGTVDWERFNRLKELRHAELSQMKEYLQTDSCLLEFLRHQLDDQTAGPCERCAACQSGPIVSHEIDQSLVAKAHYFLSSDTIIIEPRKQVPYTPWLGIDQPSLPDQLRPQKGRVLSYWGSGPLATAVRTGKYRDGQFSSELIEAAAGLIRNRWNPDPFPEMVVPVPSSRNANLVPALARSLATRLELEYVPAVLATGSRRPQKEMENSAHQARNVENAFRIDHSVASKVRGRVVLLVDDLVDSRWTITTISVLLKRNSCRIVYPLALSNTAARA